MKTKAKYYTKDTFNDEHITGVSIVRNGTGIAFIEAVPDEDGTIDDWIVTPEARANAKLICDALNAYTK